MSEYKEVLRIQSKDCDANRRLKASSLLFLHQEMCIRHTTLLGYGKEKTLDKGLLWVIDKQSYIINRLPEYDEEVILKTSPGRMLHYFFPRYFEIEDLNGKPLIKASSLWSLIDQENRRIIDPTEHDIIIEGIDMDGFPMLPIRRNQEYQNHAILTADFESCDLNGHLSNASYVKMLSSLINDDYLLSHYISRMDFIFQKEIRMKEKEEFTYELNDDDFHASSKSFDIHIVYKNKDLL